MLAWHDNEELLQELGLPRINTKLFWVTICSQWLQTHIKWLRLLPYFDNVVTLRMCAKIIL